MFVPQVNKATRSVQCIAYDSNYGRRAWSLEMLWNGQACCEAAYFFIGSVVKSHIKNCCNYAGLAARVSDVVVREVER
jgi:hypothetical protein